MIKLFFKNLLYVLNVVAAIILFVTISSILFTSVLILFVFLFTDQTIPIMGWVIVILCIPSIAMIKTRVQIKAGD